MTLALLEAASTKTDAGSLITGFFLLAILAGLAGAIITGAVLLILRIARGRRAELDRPEARAEAERKAVARQAEQEHKAVVRRAEQEGKAVVRRAEQEYKTIVRSAEQALSASQREHNARVNEAEAAFGTAQQQYNRNLAESVRTLCDAEKAHQAAVKQAERQCQQAEKVGHAGIGSYGSIRAYEHMITTGQGTFPMNESVRATVDTAGNLATKSRATLTRMAAGGFVLGPLGILIGASAKKNSVIDTRELYLMVEGDGFASVQQCQPDHGPRVRQLAMSINQAGKQAAAAQAAHDHAVAQARLQLQAVQNDTRAIVEAQGHLEEVRAQTQPVHQASERLQIAREDTGMIEARQHELDASRANTSSIDAARAEFTAIEARNGQKETPGAPRR